MYELRAANMKAAQRSLCNSNRHQTKYHQRSLVRACAAASLAMLSAALASLHKGLTAARANAGHDNRDYVLGGKTGGGWSVQPGRTKADERCNSCLQTSEAQKIQGGVF